jgi:hypothetical protein
MAQTREKMSKIDFGPGFLFVGEPPFTQDNLLGSVGMEKKHEDVKEKKKMLDRIEKWLEERLSGKYYVQYFIKGFLFTMVVGLFLTSMLMFLMTASPWWFMLNIASPVMVGIINVVS